jgi:hypothetical protein
MPQPPTILGPEIPLTRFQAQRKLGLFAPLDYSVLALIVFVWIVLGFWALFGTPSANSLIALAIVNIFLTQCWIVVLVYRCLVFILDVQADINLMPEAAARIVVGFWEGRRAGNVK